MLTHRMDVVLSPVKLYNTTKNIWINLYNKNWDGNMQMCYITPYNKFVCIGKPLWPIKNKTYQSQNQIYVYDHNKDMLQSTNIQLPRINIMYSITITNNNQTNMTIIKRYLNKHSNIKTHYIHHIINNYADLWTLHIIDNHSDHYTLNIDIIFNNIY